jgi:hypothetical protein
MKTGATAAASTMRARATCVPRPWVGGWGHLAVGFVSLERAARARNLLMTALTEPDRTGCGGGGGGGGGGGTAARRVAIVAERSCGDVYAS